MSDRRQRVSAQDDEAPFYTWLFMLMGMGLIAAMWIITAVFYTLVGIVMFVVMCFKNGVRPTCRTLRDHIIEKIK